MHLHTAALEGSTSRSAYTCNMQRNTHVYYTTTVCYSDVNKNFQHYTIHINTLGVLFSLPHRSLHITNIKQYTLDALYVAQCVVMLYRLHQLWLGLEV